jgi:hypothetical protein
MIILGTNSIKETGFNVANSCRFDGASSVMYVDTSSASTNKVTISAWIKRSKITADGFIITSYRDNNNRAKFGFGGADNLTYFMTEGGTDTEWNTTAKFRDIGAWYHVVAQLDNTQSTFANRCKLFVNGVEYATSSSGSSTQNSATAIIGNGTTSVGNSYYGGAYQGNWFGGYMAQVAMIQGVIHAPTDFGEFDEDSGIWKPIDITGLTYASYSFLLDFEDSSNLGNNASGSGLADLTEAGLAATDQSTDTCTNNFATLNPLNSSSNDSHTPPTYSEGNLQSASPSSGGGYVGSSTIGVTNGKWFWEFKKSGGSATNIYNGIGNEVGTAEIARQSAVGVYFGNQVFYRPDGTKQIITNGSNANSSYGASWTTNDIIGIALDLDSSTNTVTFYKNGASQGAINLPVNTDTWFFIVACGTDTVDTWQLNFGSPPYAISSGNTDGNGYGNFEYSVPSGYYSLNTKNLAEHG